MKQIDDLSLFNETTFGVDLFPDETNTFDDPSDIDFKWTVVEFTAQSMKVQIEWAKIYQISAGVDRDVLKITIKDQNLFISNSTLLAIPVGSED